MLGCVFFTHRLETDIYLQTDTEIQIIPAGNSRNLNRISFSYYFVSLWLYKLIFWTLLHCLNSSELSMASWWVFALFPAPMRRQGKITQLWPLWDEITWKYTTDSSDSYEGRLQGNITQEATVVFFAYDKPFWPHL